MINPELEKYVETSFKNNMDGATIRRVLVSAGWNSAEVDEALAVHGKTLEPTLGATAASPAASPSITASGPAFAGNVTAPKSRLPQMSKKSFLIMGGAVLALFILGGLAFAFYSGNLFSRGMSDQELLANLPDNLQAIKSATYEGNLEFNSEPRSAGAMPFIVSDYYYQAPQLTPAPTLAPTSVTSSPTDTGPTMPTPASDLPPSAYFLQDVGQYFAQIPSDISVRLTAGGSSSNTNVSSTDATFHGGAEVKLADFNISADADFLKKNTTLYFRINKFPSLFVDLSALKGKWVSITPDDLGGSAGWFGFVDASSIQDLVNDSQNKNQKSLEQMRWVYRMAAEDGLVSMSAPAKSEKVDGQNTRHFQLTLAKDKIAPFYTRATTELKNKYGDEAIWTFDQETANYLASPAFGKLYDYLNANSSFDLWLNQKTGQLAKYSYSLRLVPPPAVEKLKDTQFALKFSLALKDVNKPITVSTPTDVMNFDDAQILLSGKSREEFLAERQIENIRSLQYNLEIYRDYAQKYPDTLDALIISYADLYKMSSTTQDSLFESYTGESKLLAKVPVDAYTQKPYLYKNNGADFSIEYTVTIPPGNASYPLTEVVNGMNHAMRKTLSAEKKPAGL